MWWYDLRDWALNNLAVWCMKHCHPWATCFYTSCRCMTPYEIELQAKSAIEAKKKGEFHL